MRPNNVKEMVNFKTRDLGTLDWFLTNKPQVSQLFQLSNVTTADHYLILEKKTFNYSYTFPVS